MDVSDDEEPPLAPEGDMAAAMVASLVTRLVERAITAGEYDVYSAGQTRRLGDLVDLISDYTGKEGQTYKVRRWLAICGSTDTFAGSLESLARDVPRGDPFPRHARFSSTRPLGNTTAGIRSGFSCGTGNVYEPPLEARQEHARLAAVRTRRDQAARRDRPRSGRQAVPE
jgi:hypothetical protein